MSVDYFIVSGAGLIKGEVLDFIQPKAINVHLGHAQFYRGLDTNLWALYHKDYKNIGVTLHNLEEQLDTGDVYNFKSINLSKKIDIWKLRYFESKLVTEMIKNLINDLSKGSLNLKKQVQIGRYYSFMPSVIKILCQLIFHKIGYINY